MRYSGIECVACNNTFDEKDDVVVCPVCGAPHHRACWMKENRCAYNDRHQKGFVWEFPKQAEAEPEKSEKPQTIGDFVFKNGEGVIICPECKTPNFANDAFCRKCHKPFPQTAGGTNQPDNSNKNVGTDNQNVNNQYTNNQNTDYGQPNRQNVPPQNNAFFQESINRFGGLHPESTVDTIPVVEYSDYIGGKAPGKIIRKISFLERYGKKTIFHLPALFLGPAWFFYRKMIKEGLISSLVLLLCSVLCCFTMLTQPYIDYSKATFEAVIMYAEQEISYQEYIEYANEAYSVYLSTVMTPEDTVKNYVAVATDYIAALGIPLACALLSIKLYRKKVKEDIFNIRTQCNDMYTYRSSLVSNGGTSPALAIVGVMIIVIAALVRSTLPMFIAMLI
ncbi:MAG: DUF2628 domain-containing protein [Clostridia bacterium]|nr:DUF2628 domain-containing protein [Clostridia bacterium]